MHFQILLLGINIFACSNVGKAFFIFKIKKLYNMALKTIVSLIIKYLLCKITIFSLSKIDFVNTVIVLNDFGILNSTDLNLFEI